VRERRGFFAAGAPEVFRVFLVLGLTSFGGPVAHFVIFRREFVERRAWVGEAEFGHLLALSQFLPGPGSSKLGFVLGLLRAGWPGAIAAFVGFTLPSALLLFGFAALLPRLSGVAGVAALHGLKLVALCVVGYGLIGMFRSLCPDAPRRALALGAAVIMLALGHAWAQLLVVGLGAVGGVLACRGLKAGFEGDFVLPYGARTGALLLTTFALMVLCLPLAAGLPPGLVRYGAAFFRSGALVFGGGHVVLPLWQEALVAPGWIAPADFLAGYGAAQAVPGPMFALAAYLGASLPGAGGGLAGALVALCATFLPGFLLMAGVLPFWRTVAAHPVAARAIAGVSAAVVGLLAAALYDPVWISAVHAPSDLVIAALGFALLARWRVSAVLVVLFCAGASVALALL